MKKSTYETPTLSLAVADILITPLAVPPLDGLVIDTVGEVVSCTFTVKLPVAVLPAASVAEQFTVVVVIPNVEPEAGVHVTGTGPSTLSVAVAVYVTTAPNGPVASAVIAEGSVNTGGVVSEGGGLEIVRLNMADAGDMFPALSVAFPVML